MMNYATLLLEVDARGVAYLTLNRPARKNALSAAMMDELSDFAQTAPTRGDIRVVVLSGAGGTFCAGGDLEWMLAQIKADRETRIFEAKRLANMLGALNDMPLPLIGRIEGAALGGGGGIAAICDLAIAADDCRFGFTETRLGIIPATISPYVLARMGEGAARQVFMNSRLFGGEEAARLGLIARSVPQSGLDQAIEEEISHYLKLPIGAVARAKRLARSLGPSIDAACIDQSIEALADAWDTEEAHEGISAFLEKRQPDWGKTKG